MKAILLVLTLALVACSSCAAAPVPAPTPTPVPTPAPPIVMADAAPVLSLAERICNQLNALGCDDAESPHVCSAVLQHAIDTHLVAVPSDCLLAATTKLEARRCGLVSCP